MDIAIAARAPVKLDLRISLSEMRLDFVFPELEAVLRSSSQARFV